MATAGPGGASRTDAPRRRRRSRPPRRPTPGADDTVFVTAGPDGVVEHRGAETRTLTTEPMAIALRWATRTPSFSARRQRRDRAGPTPTPCRSCSRRTVHWLRCCPASTGAARSCSTTSRSSTTAGCSFTACRTAVVAAASVRGPLRRRPRHDGADRVAADIGGWEFGTGPAAPARPPASSSGESSGEASDWLAMFAVPDSRRSRPPSADRGRPRTGGVLQRLRRLPACASPSPRTARPSAGWPTASSSPWRSVRRSVSRHPP